MIPGSLIDSLLLRVSRGEENCLSQTLAHLADEIVFAPIIKFEDSSTDRLLKKIKIATIVSDGRRCVPAFTSEDYLLDWAQGSDYQCLPVTGADLALSLEAGNVLLLNPGQENSVFLSRENMELLCQIARESCLGERPLPLESSDAHMSCSKECEDLSARPNANKEGSINEVCDELTAVLREFCEVSEAYCMESQNDSTCYMVGLILDRIDSEKRFSLIERIGDVSRKHFGSAGAIEVYDDSIMKMSDSWELLAALAPFYIRGPIEGRVESEIEPAQKSLAAKIEQETEREFVLGEDLRTGSLSMDDIPPPAKRRGVFI